MAYELLTWKAWAANATRDEIAEKLALQQAEIVRMREAVKVLAVGIAPLVGATDGDDICLTWDAAQNIRIAMSNPISAAAVREAGR